MLVLGVETATDTAGVALADEHGVLGSVSVGGGRRHGESVAPAVQFVCARAALSLAELDAVAVDVGPGLFTGLRVGLGTAMALGFALGRPVVEVGSLELLAVAAARWLARGEDAERLLVPVVDARRGLLFSSRFSMLRAGAGDSGVTGAEVARAGEDRLVHPDELAGELAELVGSGKAIACVGDGALRYRELLETAGAVVFSAGRSPDAAVLAQMGVARLGAGAGVAAEAVTARYLRPADVRINWETRRPARAVTGS